MSESHQNLITYVQGKLLSWNKSVKQFKLLRVTCDTSSWILLKKRKNNYPDNFLRASEQTQTKTFELYNYITKFW